jgi:Zn-finger nucleic acid-binding protein
MATACSFCGTTSVPPPRVVEREVEREVERVVERVVVRDRTGAPATLACLRCAESMRDAEIDGMAVSQCPRCGGAWVPADVAASLRRRSNDELRAYVVRGEMLALARPSREALTCPICSAPMECVPLAETVHDVDVCKAHGTWFDRTELIAFMDREKTRREM